MAIELFNDGSHQCIKFDDLVTGSDIPANQFLICEDKRGFLIDPGGNKLFPRLTTAIAKYCPPQRLDHLFLSHQDPDVGAGLNGWLLICDAQILVSALWTRFIPSFCTKQLTTDRVTAIPDEGMAVPFGRSELQIVPAHFLHSPGNFHVYDPRARILFTGDLGVAVGGPVENVQTMAEFQATVPHMEGFHSRYMPHSLATQPWVQRVRPLAIDMIVPQHGSRFTGAAVVTAFIDWVAQVKGYLG